MATIDEFQQWRFAMFIHWGAYSVPARGEWVLERERVPLALYDEWIDGFGAERFDATAWAELARAAGMRYVVFMTRYTKRVQAVLSEEQYEALSRLARESGKPVSLLIREAVEGVYFEAAERERRRAALAELLALEAPVADWEQMEEEIIQGALA